MNDWSVQEARGRFKDIFDAACADGPQRVSRHGREAVIVVSEAEWDRLQKAVPSFAQLLLSCPLSDDDLPRRKPLSERGEPF